MPTYLTNRLHFSSNAAFILDLIRAREPGEAPALFSLDAVKPMPKSLELPLTREIRALALLNMALPQSVPEVDAVARAKLFKNAPGKQSPAAIEEAILSTHRKLSRRRSKDQTAQAYFDRAIENYRRHRYFCRLDWRWAEWGSIEDVHSVATESFEMPTTAIEFTTRWTPPIAAMESLAQMFPSVRFELYYRYRRSDAWWQTEIFPITPFGY